MKTLTALFIAVLSLGFVSNNVFANKTNWGLEEKHYRYAVIEGEVTSIDHDNMVLTVEGVDENIHFDNCTAFYSGDMSLSLERVVHPVRFTNDQEINAFMIKEGDIVKFRYAVKEDGSMLLDTCLVGTTLPGTDANADYVVAGD